VPVNVTVISQSAPLAAFGGVRNNATFAAGEALAPGGIVAVFGEQLSLRDPAVAPSLPLPTELGGTRVLLNGQPVPIYYSSYDQVNFQIPFDTPAGEATVRVEREGQPGNTVTVRIAKAMPRILRLNIRDYGIIVNEDGSFPIPATPGVASRPAKPGDALVIYALGLGQTSPSVTAGAASPSSPLARVNANYRVTFGGGFTQPITVEPFFVGLTPGFFGLYQLNVIVPEDAARGNDVPLVIAGDDGTSNVVTLAIQ
jgi:uncharacterized protein (TIGR03437 family)